MARLDLEVGGRESKKSDPGRSITLFLSLYLLVLAFFILLVSISTVEDIKSKALMQSLTSTFSTVLPPQMELKAFNSTTGEFLAADEFQRQVTGLFSTVIGVEKIDTIQPGRLMRVELDGDGLFLENSSQIRENQSAFMDRLVAALSSSPPGLKFDMEFVIPVPWLENKLLPSENTLNIERAGAFARDLILRGAPENAIMIGIKGSERATLELWFHIRAVETNRIRFEDSPLINLPDPDPSELENQTPAPVTLVPLNNGGVTLDLPLPEPSGQTPNPDPSVGSPRLLLPNNNAPQSLIPSAPGGGDP